MKRILGQVATATLFTVALLCGTPGNSHAQTADPATLPPPHRSEAWASVTDVTVVSAIGLALLMPRFYYPNNELTLGWKSRWHVSALAPVMTYSTLTLVNEQFLKDGIKGARPGCDERPFGSPNCTTYGGPSSHAFAAGSALGHGIAVFMFDTIRSDYQVNPISVVGNLAAPFVLGAITVVGRSAGDHEDAGQILAGALPGLGVGFLLGMTYATMQRPECGYSGGLICW